MPKEYASIALGVASMLFSFAPIIPIQLIGFAGGLAGFILGRRAKREDYRKDFPSVVGMVCSGVGMFLCLLTPVLFLVSNLILMVGGR